MIFKHMPSDLRFEKVKSEDLPYSGNNGTAGMCNIKSPKSKTSCPGCGSRRENDYFLIVPPNGIHWVDDSNKTRSIYCIHCVLQMYKDFLAQEETHNEYKVLYKWCSVLGYYYNDELAHQVMEEDHTWEDGTPVKYIPKCVLYVKALAAHPAYHLRSFWDDPSNFSYDNCVKIQRGIQEGEEGMDEQTRKSRRAVISIFHYDPFDDEPIKERMRLYEDLLTLCDENTSQDLVRAKSAVSLVLGFRNLDRLNKTISELQSTSASMKENADVIKKLTEQKQKETAMISSFAKDNGFSERYATTKAKGSGTLSAIVRDMDLYGYDDGAVNMFNIEMSGAMQQVSDISAESMFKQLALTDSDYALMVKEQGTIIRKMQKTLNTQAEELRLLKSEYLRQELVEKYKKELQERGIKPEEVSELVNDELQYVPSALGNTFYTAQELQEAASAREAEEEKEADSEEKISEET